MVLSNSEKQKRYRERKRVERNQYTSIIELLERKKVTLLDCIESYEKEGETRIAVIRKLDGVRQHNVTVNGHYRNAIEDLLFQYLLIRGCIEFDRLEYNKDLYKVVS